MEAVPLMLAASAQDQEITAVNATMVTL